MTLPSGLSPQLTPQISFAVRLGAGPSAPTTGMRVMLLGSKTSAGTATDHIPTQVFDVEDAEARFGARSHLAAMVRAFRAIAPRASLFACPVAPADGGVAATAVLTFAGPATATGVIRLRVAGRPLREVVIPSGTTAAQAAALVAAAVAESSALPCTGAVGGSGSEHILTLTASTVGTVGNGLRVSFELTATGITVALNQLSAAVRGKAYFGSGAPATAGTGAVSLTAALAAIAGERYDRIVSDLVDDAPRSALAAHVLAQSAIGTGRRCMAYVGSTTEDVSAGAGSVQADAIALNESRVTLVYQRRGHNLPGEIAAAYAAAKLYGDGRLPGEVQYRAAKANALSLHPAILATDEEERLTATQVESLLQAGVTPVGEDGLHPGFAAIVRPVTTRTLNSSGGRSFAVTDPSKVVVADVVADRCEAWAAEAYADKNLVPDPASIEVAPSSPFVVWPAAVRDDMLSILYQMEAEALLVNVADHADAVTVSPATIDGTQYLVCKIPLAVIPHLHSVVGEALQIA